MTKHELDMLCGDLLDENTRLKQQLAQVTRERDEMRDAYSEQVDLTIRINNRECPRCAMLDAKRERFERESA